MYDPVITYSTFYLSMLFSIIRKYSKKILNVQGKNSYPNSKHSTGLNKSNHLANNNISLGIKLMKKGALFGILCIFPKLRNF